MTSVKPRLGKTYVTAEQLPWRATLGARLMRALTSRQPKTRHESCYRLSRGRQRLLLSSGQGWWKVPKMTKHSLSGIVFEHLRVLWKWTHHCLEGLQCRNWRGLFRGVAGTSRYPSRPNEPTSSPGVQQSWHADWCLQCPLQHAGPAACSTSNGIYSRRGD